LAMQSFVLYGVPSSTRTQSRGLGKTSDVNVFNASRVLL